MHSSYYRVHIYEDVCIRRARARASARGGGASRGDTTGVIRGGRRAREYKWTSARCNIVYHL